VANKSQAAGLDASGQDARLYIGNIHVSVEEPALKLILDQYGPTESVKLHRDHLGNSKGFAFVKYVRAESAALAAVGLAGQELMGRALKIGPVIDQKVAAMNAAAAQGVLGVASMGGASMGGSTDSGNWKLDADEGGAGLALNASSRMALIAKLGQAAGITVPAMPAVPVPQLLVPGAAGAAGAAVVPPVSGVPSINVLVCNMFDPVQEAAEGGPEWDQDIREDMLEECSKYGQLDTVHVEKNKPGGIVLMKFLTVTAAMKAAQALNGRFFAGRMITAAFLDDNMFSTMLL
jgi:RNA-binding protein 23/39